MELTKEEFQRILNWYQAWQSERGSDIDDMDLAVKIVKSINDLK